MTLIRGIPKFDGTPSKFQDWKRATRAMLQLARPGIFEILDGQKRPQDIYTQVPHRSTMNTPAHSVADGDGDDSDNVENEQGLAEELQEAGPSLALDVAAPMYRLGTERSNVRTDSPELATAQRVTAEQQQQDSHTGGTTEEVRTPLNMDELTKWDQANAALFSVLSLITTGA